MLQHMRRAEVAIRFDAGDWNDNDITKETWDYSMKLLLSKRLESVTIYSNATRTKDFAYMQSNVFEWEG